MVFIFCVLFPKWLLRLFLFIFIIIFIYTVISPFKYQNYKTPVNNIIIATITGKHSFKSFFAPLL